MNELYLIVVLEHHDGEPYWREVGRDDTESCAWDYAGIWLLDNLAHSWDDIGVLKVLK